MALDMRRIPFGVADFTIDPGGPDETIFDGSSEFQFEGGEATITPMISDMNLADFGESVIGGWVNGYEGTVTINAGQASLKVMNNAIMTGRQVTNETSGEVEGITDDKIGTLVNDKAKALRIHPRNLPTSDQSMDIFLYQVASVGDFTRSFAAEQSGIPLELTMYPRTDLDASKPNNFYRIGVASETSGREEPVEGGTGA